MSIQWSATTTLSPDGRGRYKQYKHITYGVLVKVATTTVDDLASTVCHNYDVT